MKIAQLVEGTSPSSLRRSLVDFLTKNGFTSPKQESSPGALKAWLSSDVVDLKALAAKLNDKFPGSKLLKPSYEYELPTIIGKGFEINQLKNGIFLAVYRNSPAGQEYQYGIDS